MLQRSMGSDSQPQPAAAGKSRTLLTALLILVALLGAAIASSWYLYTQLSAYKNNPQKIVEEQVDEVVAKVGELMVLPEGEVPTLATVADLEQLKDQPFFAKAKVGDKVLIYTNAKKAILYDPVAHKILEVAPLNIGDDAAAAPAAPAEGPSPEPQTPDTENETSSQ